MGACGNRERCRNCLLPKKKVDFACTCFNDRLICADCAKSHQAIASDSHRISQSIDIRKLQIRTLGLRKEENEKLKGSYEAKTTLIHYTLYPIYFSSINQLRKSRIAIIYNVLRHSQWVWMEGSVFGCGYEYSMYGDLPQLVFEMETDGTIIRLPKMRKSRYNRTLWWDSAGKQVLAFGGICYKRKFSKKYRGCERLTWCSTSWQQLPKMRDRRSDLTACEFHGLIYLCGGANNGSIEQFDPRTLLFRFPLILSLPICSRSSYLSIVESDQLIVICELYMIRFGASPRHGLRKLSAKPLNLHYLSVGKPPLVDSVNGLIYLSDLVGYKNNSTREIIDRAKLGAIS